jgi:NAD+ synthase (glutamine-hydrolysing)
MTKKVNYFDYGYVRCSAVSPKLYLAKPMKNAEKVIEIAKQESEKQSLIVLFPELGLTGYTCEDLFHSQDLLDDTRKALVHIIKNSVKISSIIVVGHPYQLFDGRMFNCASVIHQGKILAMVPKSYIPEGNEYYEKRWFQSGMGLNLEIKDFEQTFRFSPDQVVNYKNKVILGVEICEDSWAVVSPSTRLCLGGKNSSGGANIICNLSASNELVGKNDYRRALIMNHSARLNCGYVYTSANAWESSKDLVFGGSIIVSENGTVLAEGKRFSFEDQIVSFEFDVQKLNMERCKNITFGVSPREYDIHNIHLDNTFEYCLDNLSRTYSKTPFIPNDPVTLIERSEEILNIQSTGLARRMLSLGKTKLVLGLSGGLDSTLALLVCVEAVKKLNQPLTDIICISMPGFGSSQRTKDQSRRLAKRNGVTFEEIDITNTVRSHFKDIGHDENNHNTVYENAQARERTKLLFNKANGVSDGFSGIVVGTGNWTEQGCSWMTFGGDHLSSYNVNTSVPKTLVQHLIRYFKEYRTQDEQLKVVLQNILDTKISPELLPPDENGNFQESELTVGPFLLIDFFLFHYIRNKFSLEKIYEIAVMTFKNQYSPVELKKWMDICFDRFKKGQFKRSVSPSGPMLGLSWSSRGAWRMPDENT